jgi:hypothetical protein
MKFPINFPTKFPAKNIRNIVCGLIGIVENLIKLLSLGFFIPSLLMKFSALEMKYLIWAKRRDERSRII